MLPYVALGFALLAIAQGRSKSQPQLAHKYNGPGPRRRDSDVANLNFTEVAGKTVPFTLWGGTNHPNGLPPVWYWNVSIQQAPCPEAADTNGTVMNVEYSFSWNNTSKDKSLKHELLGASDKFDPNQFCVTVVENAFAPDSVRNYDARSEEDARGSKSCLGPFHLKCLEYVVKAYEKREPAANGCRGGNIDLSKRTLHEFPQCEMNWNNGFYQASTYDLLKKDTADMSLPGSFPLKSGDGFAYQGTDVYDLHNRTHFDMANERVHAIIIQSGDHVVPLCMRVKDRNIYDFQGDPEQIVSLKEKPIPSINTNVIDVQT